MLGALTNALRVVGKKLADVRIVLSGAGAAGSAILDLLLAGRRHRRRRRRRRTASCTPTRGDLDASLAAIAERTNRRGLDRAARRGACAGADVFIGVSAPNVIDRGRRARRWRRGAIVFALANPDPEIDPWLARRHAAVVATGRSDFPNQINNVLAFPGVFRGLLDAQSHADPARRRCSPRPTALADVVDRRRAPRQLHRAERVPPRPGDDRRRRRAARPCEDAAADG